MRAPQILARLALVTALALPLTGCGYNSIQAQDEDVGAAWSEVLNQYKRRADLVPNLVKTVQGFAVQEKDVLTSVTQARAQATSVKIDGAMLNDPAALERFQAAQSALSSSLGRLLAVSENYPQLKSDQGFRDLQAQLEGTENRIAVARNRYIDSVKIYNTTVRQFPANITAKVTGAQVKPNLKVENEAQISEAPQIDFGVKK
jgi:LemA protein